MEGSDMRLLVATILIVLFVGCSSLSVRQQDLAAWQGVPVAALDTHAVWVTVPMKKVLREDGGFL